MPRVRPEHKAERRAQIIAAARACFARAGFHRTTLQDVFAEAGLSAGCVYNYFQSKEELVLAIADDRHQDERRALAGGSKTQDPVEGLHKIAKHFAETYLSADGDERRRIAIQTWSEAMLDKAVLASVLEGVDAPRTQLAALIRRGQALKTISASLDANAVARTMIALLHGFLLQKLWDSKLDFGASFAVFERFLSSLSPQADDPVMRSKRKV